MTLIGLGFAQVFIVVTVIAIKLKRVVDAATLQQHSRNLERTLRAIQSTKLLRHPAVFITYESLRRQGRIPSHEDARASGELHVVDTWEMLLQFVDDEATLFVSHQWQASALDPCPVEPQLVRPVTLGFSDPCFDARTAGSVAPRQSAPSQFELSICRFRHRRL